MHGIHLNESNWDPTEANGEGIQLRILSNPVTQFLHAHIYMRLELDRVRWHIEIQAREDTITFSK